jgi:hypothetical protein
LDVCLWGVSVVANVVAVVVVVVVAVLVVVAVVVVEAVVVDVVVAAVVAAVVVVVVVMWSWVVTAGSTPLKNGLFVEAKGNFCWVVIDTLGFI